MTEKKIKPNDLDNNNTSKKDEENRDLPRLKRILFWILAIAVVAAALIMSGYLLNFQQTGISKNPNDWGVFGDFIGGTLNPLVSLLAFSALLYTIYLQTKALQISQKELHESTETLKLTKDELAASKVAQQNQSEALHKQNTDNTFFNLLKLIRETREACSHESDIGVKRPPTSTLKGFLSACMREALKTGANNGVTENKVDGKTHYGIHNQSVFSEYVNQIYLKSIKSSQDNASSDIAAFVRSVISAIEFILDEVPFNVRKKYFRILISQLTTTDLLLLGIHALGPYHESLQAILIEYNLMETVRQEHKTPHALAILSRYG